MKRKKLVADIIDIEREHARSQTDTLGNSTARLIHNIYRQRAGLPRIRHSDLPMWFADQRCYEDRPLPLMPR